MTKVKIESDDDLTLGKILNIPVIIIVIIVRSVFQENNKYYPQVHLHKCFYECEYEDDSYSNVLMINFEKVNLNHTYYFFDDIDLNLLSINKKCMKTTDAFVYKIKYITMQSINNQNIDKKIPLCLSFSDVDAYIIGENENKYLIFALAQNNKEVLDAYKKLWSKIKTIKTINSGKSIRYKNDFMKIRLDPYDDLPLNKILCFFVLNRLYEFVFQTKIEHYSQIHIN